MKLTIAVLSLLACATVACAQNPDPAKWMCRNVSESGGFVYQGETVFGPQACRPIQQTATAEPKHDVVPPAAASAPEASTGAPADGPQVEQNPSKVFLLQDGTPVHLVLSENLSSADAVTGQTVEFEVVDDVVVDGLLVIPHGSTAWATITDAEHKKRMGRAGKLDMNIDKVRLADGQKVLLRAVKDARGGTHTGAMVGAMVVTSLVVWPAAPLFLLMHGKDVTIPKGTNISAFVQGDITLDEAKFQKKLVASK